MKYYEVKFCVSDHHGMAEEAKDVLMTLAGEAGFESFDEGPNGEVLGYVQQALFDVAKLSAQIAMMPFPGVSVSYEIAVAEDRDWNEQWESEGFEPIVVDNKVVIHDGRHLPDSAGGDLCRIEIDARQAFGTGNHETTRMMISHLLNCPLEGKRVLDCGTGTGILSIAALKLGAAEAVGYDIDEWSVDNARHNAVVNGVDARFTSLLGDSSVLPTLSGLFDVVLANINRNIILADLPRIVEKMSRHGLFIASGFYREDLGLIAESAKKLHLALVAEMADDAWQSCVFIAERHDKDTEKGATC